MAERSNAEQADDLLQVARRVVWFKDPHDTLAAPAFFLAHVMTFGTIDDVLTVRRYYDDEAFAAALDEAPAGIFDERSWAYWHTVLHGTRPPARPARTLPDSSASAR